jgi:photosynthetic reaction center H subunit
MNTPLIAGSIDIAELCFYLFFAFFIGLVIYLRREDRREGYPLEDDVTGRLINREGVLNTALPKTFNLPFDQGSLTVPNGERDPFDVPNARRTSPYSGTPLEPVGDPIGAGVGPGARAQRAKYPDVTHEGHLRIVPISSVPEITIAEQDVDPRGLTIYGADNLAAGTVTDIWIDRSEMMIRYLDVDTGSSKVLVPMTMVLVDRRGAVTCSALNAAQFVGAPRPAKAGEITRDEEEQVVAYFGSGYLYASADRQEPLM